MGMILQLAPLRDVTIERLVADPPLVWQLVMPDEPEFYERLRREAIARSRPGLLSRLFGGARAPDPPPPEPEPLALADGEGVMVDVDKAWHGIHYLLTGSAWQGEPPLDFLVNGGREVGSEDVGYGTARVFTASETRAIAGAVDRLSDDELRSRFSPDDMMAKEIYPEIWDRDPDDDDTLGYLIEHLGTLRETVATAVRNGHGLIVLVS